MKIFNREPAMWLALIASGVSLLSAFVLDLTSDQQTVLNAVAVSVVGLVTAWAVARDRLLPALVGVAQAILNVGLAFGLDLNAERQAIVMSFIATLAAAIIIRPQVTASVPAEAVDA